MIDVAAIPTEPPSRLRYQHRIGLWAGLRNLARRNELVASLVRRDFTARYKQTVLGVGWSIIQPLAMVTVLALFVQRVTKTDTEGVPYVLWSYVGLVPWTFFSSALNAGGLSLVTNQPLLNKVYCPREIFPVSAVILAGIDALFSTVGLIVLFAVYGVVPKATIYWLPLLLGVQIIFAVAVALICSIVTVYFRDVRQMLPIVLQLGLFASPVAWGLNQIPARDRLAYCLLNPGGAVIDDLRRTVLYGGAPEWPQLGAAVLTISLLLVVGFRFFKRFEMGIADIL